MKTAISISDELFLAADRIAKKLGISRSEVYQKALAAFIERIDDGSVTERLDRIYKGGENRKGLDPVLSKMQAASLEKKEW